MPVGAGSRETQMYCSVPGLTTGAKQVTNLNVLERNAPGFTELTDAMDSSKRIVNWKAPNSGEPATATS